VPAQFRDWGTEMNTPQDQAVAESAPHVPPMIERLGSLSDLTQGAWGADVTILGGS